MKTSSRIITLFLASAIGLTNPTKAANSSHLPAIITGAAICAMIGAGIGYLAAEEEESKNQTNTGPIDKNDFIEKAKLFIQKYRKQIYMAAGATIGSFLGGGIGAAIAKNNDFNSKRKVTRRS